MNPNDAAALFWFARNQLYYDLELAAHADVMLCRYEHLAMEPSALMRRVYDFAGVTCPDLSHTRQVHSSSVSKGKSLELLPEVRALCEQLQARLDAQYELQSKMPAVADAAAKRARRACNRRCCNERRSRPIRGIGGRAAVISITRLMNQGLLLISPMLLTRLLSVEEFGQYREFLLYATVLEVIAAYNIFTSLLRFVAHQPEHRQQFVDQALLMTLGTSTLVVVGTAVLNWIFDGALVGNYMLPLGVFIFVYVNFDFWEHMWLAQRRVGAVFAYTTGRLIARMVTVVTAAWLTSDVQVIIWSLVTLEARAISRVAVHVGSLPAARTTATRIGLARAAALLRPDRRGACARGAEQIHGQPVRRQAPRPGRPGALRDRHLHAADHHRVAQLAVGCAAAGNVVAAALAAAWRFPGALAAHDDRGCDPADSGCRAARALCGHDRRDALLGGVPACRAGVPDLSAGAVPRDRRLCRAAARDQPDCAADVRQPRVLVVERDPAGDPAADRGSARRARWHSSFRA